MLKKTIDLHQPKMSGFCNLCNTSIPFGRKDIIELMITFFHYFMTMYWHYILKDYFLMGDSIKELFSNIEIGWYQFQIKIKGQLKRKTLKQI